MGTRNGMRQGTLIRGHGKCPSYPAGPQCLAGEERKHGRTKMEVGKMMATKMNGFRKAVLVGTIVATFGMPLVGRAQEKAIESFRKSDSPSIEYSISKRMREREMSKENLRKEIEKLAQKMDSLQSKEDSLSKLDDGASYKKEEAAREKDEGRLKGLLRVVQAVSWIAYTLGCVMLWLHYKKPKSIQEQKDSQSAGQ